MKTVKVNRAPVRIRHSVQPGLGGCYTTTITKAHNIELLWPITSDDIYRALFQIHPDKSSGSNGMNLTFYKRF